MIGPIVSFRRRLLHWYDAHRRDLPWRRIDPATSRPDPYHVLVSELMLQQTQVATVIDYFHRFIEQWPTVSDLAQAEEQAVLRRWQGLGYYSRARHLHKAARRIVERFGGQVPASVDELLTLPGIGRYTAGAIASIAHGRRAPILDGNVIRVLCRLDGIEEDPRQPAVQKRLWDRAEAVLPARRIGDFNSALMELGAIICRPRSPACLICPVRMHCKAAAESRQEAIPPIQRRVATPLNRRWTYCIEHRGQWLIEQRPGKGRWAGLWQFVTLDSPSATEPLGLKVTDWQSLGTIRHVLTHRRYEFIVRRCKLDQRRPALADHRRWVRLDELDRFPMSKPQLQIRQWLTS